MVHRLQENPLLHEIFQVQIPQTVQKPTRSAVEKVRAQFCYSIIISLLRAPYVIAAVNVVPELREEQSACSAPRSSSRHAHSWPSHR